MRSAPAFRIEVSRRWRDDLLRWLESPAASQRSRSFAASALLSAVSIRLDEEPLGGDRMEEPLLPWLQQMVRAIAALQTSAATTVVVAWERGPLELHLTRTGPTDLLLSLLDSGASDGRSRWRVPLSIAALRDAVAAAFDAMEEEMELLPAHRVVTEMVAWLAAQRVALRELPVHPPLQRLDGRAARMTVEVSTTDASDRMLHTTLRHLEPALAYAGEETTHAGALTLPGSATLSAPFAGARIWEGDVLRRWREVAEALLQQSPDGVAQLPHADGDGDAVTVRALGSLVADHLGGIADALVRSQPLLELHPEMIRMRALVLALRRHGSGRWEPVAVRTPALPAARPPESSPVAEQGVVAGGLRQMGYHRHWTASAAPVGGRAGLLWSGASVAFATARGLESTLLHSGETAWTAAGASRGGWRLAAGGLWGFSGSNLLRRRAMDGASDEANWPIPSERMAAAAEVSGGACLLSESGLLGRWSDSPNGLRWVVSTGVNGASFLACGRERALVIGAEGTVARVALRRGSAGPTVALPWAVRMAVPLPGRVWVEGYADEAVLLDGDGAGRSGLIAVSGEAAQVWAMSDGRFGRLSAGDGAWSFEVWDASEDGVARRCLLHLAADLAAGRNVLPLRDGLLIAVRDGLIRFGVEGDRIVERWRRPMAAATELPRLVADTAETFVATLGETVVLRDLVSGRVLHEMGALWEEVIEARLLSDGGLFVVEPGIRSGLVLHGLPSPGWLGLVR